MSSVVSRRTSARSASGTTSQRPRTPLKRENCSQSTGGSAAVRARQRGSMTSQSSRGIQRGHSTSSAASSRSRISSVNSRLSGKGTPYVQRSGSYTSTAFTKGSLGGSQSGTFRCSARRGQDHLDNEGRCSSGRSNRYPRKKILSLLFGKAPVSDVRPDVYRIDASQKDDLRFLYETQHRVDPELVPVMKRANHATWEKMHRSHIFDTTPIPVRPASAATPAQKNGDGLGTLARFLLCSEKRCPTPVRGRSHRNCSAGQTTLNLFGGNNVEEGPPQQPQTTGRRKVLKQPTDMLGRDLLSRDVLGMEIRPSRGIRSLRAVQKFEEAQPKLTLPPRKRSYRGGREMRCHSASSDNDIFGVRSRRENMMRRARSASARSNNPYGLEEGDEVAQQQSVKLNNCFKYNRPTHLRSNTPFGEEEPYTIDTPTQHHSGCGSLLSSGTILTVTPLSPLSPLRKLNHIQTPSGCNSEIAGLKEGDVVKKQYLNVVGAVLTNTVPMFSDEERRPVSSLVSPRPRTGRARVPGYSLSKSNVIFGDVRVVESPRRALRQTHLRSSQMSDIFSW